VSRPESGHYGDVPWDLTLSYQGWSRLVDEYRSSKTDFELSASSCFRFARYGKRMLPFRLRSILGNRKSEHFAAPRQLFASSRGKQLGKVTHTYSTDADRLFLILIASHPISSVMAFAHTLALP
jgi:hypothetical protein